MFLVCHFYCSSFFHWLFLISSLLLLGISTYVLKRGVRQNRRGLRKLAFFLIYMAVLKIFLVDAKYIAEGMFCNQADGMCNFGAVKLFKSLSMGLLIPVSYGVYNLYRKFINMSIPAKATLKDKKIRFHANIAMAITLILMCWLVAPWVGYLVAGYAPPFLFNRYWRLLSLAGFVLISTTFWRYEDCTLNPRSKEDKAAHQKAWIPRDTLWLALALLIITHLFFIVSEDALSNFTH